MVPGVVRQARRDRRRFLAGLVVLAIVSAIVFLVATANTGFPLTSTTTVKAAFSDVGALQTGNEVREHSQRIGRVADIAYQNGQAIVTLELEGEKPVYSNARAFVWDFSSLGQKVVELRRGDPRAGPLRKGTIDGSRTKPSADLHDALNVFDTRTRRQAQTLLQEVGGGLAGGGADLHDFFRASPDLLDDLGTVSGSLAAEDARLPELLGQARTLAERFRGKSGDIATLIKQMDESMRAFAADDGQPLRETINHLPATLTAARTSLAALEKPLSNTQTAMTTLRPGASDLATAEPSLRAALREGVAPMKRVPGVVDKAVPSVSDLTRTFADARPLAPSLVRALNHLATPLTALAPYAREAGQLFVRGDSFLSEGTAMPGVHYARLAVAPNVATVTDGVARTPVIKPRNPYPAPGEADRDRATLGDDPGRDGGTR